MEWTEETIERLRALWAEGLSTAEIGRRILERLITELADVAVAETMPRQEGNQMHTILGQKAGRKSAPKRAEAPVAATEE